MVSMQCTTECFTGVSLGTGAVRADNSWSSAVNGFSTAGQGKLGLGEASLVSTQLTWTWVTESTRHPLVISTRRLKWCRKVWDA